ncbi:MAG: putative electron transport protein YccM [Candidatus Ordinivivax streblomastigis]|uniref:Putative electron transport protein YccM n=1 Tax=Candidatus Ordinivivax streblomastigis TaxID=2540710 RepID=A0A5M8NXY0_9BACT|nr:MAG: putative electron transport protein YccM [Candidatus Ordinivivax streblomastigis]
MKKLLSLLILILFSVTIQAQRFPKPDFESGYQYPAFSYAVPNETLWLTIDIILLVVLMSIVAWAVIKKRVRKPVFYVSIISVAYFGFFRNGCICSIGAIQNVSLSLVDNSYSMPFTVLLFFILPIIFALLFGRVFCAGVCPLGALQELVNIKNYRLSKSLAAVLGIIPWIYLLFAILFAVTRSTFLICRFDPFIGIFRLGGDIGLIVFGVLLLIAAIFTGRPFCRFICPYGALLSLFARVSIWKASITPQCINCELCHNACPVDAIMTPYENKVKETRLQGVKRILLYLIFLPVMAIIGGLILQLMSTSLSRVNKDVRLYDMVIQNEKEPQDILPLDLEAFYGQGGTIEEITGRVERIQSEFKTYSSVTGALIGLVIGFTLIGLSVKRTRKNYEINDAKCVNCAKCFSYCPQNKINRL